MKSLRLRNVALVALCGLLFAGCTSGPAKEAEERSSFKVLYHDERFFFQELGDLFAMKNPNIDIEVVSTNQIYNQDVTDYNKAFEDFVEKEQPDVIMLGTDNYKEFASQGKLMELDPLIERDNYDTESIFPGIINLLKEQGGGKLYGLAPTFYGNAIFYNADLFAKYGVEVPHDGMTWQEILDTARRFPTEGDKDTRVYGFGTNYGMTLDNLASSIARTQGLQYLNTNSMKMTLNTDSWKQAYKLALDALDSGAVYNPSPEEEFRGGTMEDYYKSQLFLMGRMAMVIDGSYSLQYLKEAQNAIKDYKPFQVGVAAGPVDPAAPDKSRDFGLSEIFAIRANSPNAEAAWQFIKFVNGEEYAKVKSRTLNNGLMSRMGVSKEYNGINLDVFYKLSPMPEGDSMDYNKIPDAFHSQYQTIVDREIKLMQEKKKSIDEALKTIEEEGQVVLEKAVKEEAANKKNGTEDSGSENGADPTDGDEDVITITN
ncbi:ABC transporter substrate-binding protein [Paenibacillus phocaensis]|uniref:ABC transporter substrate-binding protein n=1 Tax=Paenibacillus phocaensis TaxID=1776378 RepID=UPI000839C8D8|nr:extracellular solute-binding protein [Paenibacillus phocaensis]